MHWTAQHVLVALHAPKGNADNTARRTVAAAQQLVALKGGAFSILLLGASRAVPDDLLHTGARALYTCDGSRTGDDTGDNKDDNDNNDAAVFHPEDTPRLVACLQHALDTTGADPLLAPADAPFNELLPRVALLRQWGMVSRAAAFSHSDGRLRCHAPAHSGHLSATWQLQSPGAVLTVLAAEFGDPSSAPTTAPAPIRLLVAPPTTTEAAHRTPQYLGSDIAHTARPPLGEARIVVAAGGAIRSDEDMRLVETLADTLGAALGGTRALVDAGLMPGHLQVGQTGAIIAPDIYIAVGISGALPHLVGISAAKTIIAINTDASAPIFTRAHYGIADDFRRVLPEWLGQLRVDPQAD